MQDTYTIFFLYTIFCRRRGLAQQLLMQGKYVSK